MNLRRRGSNEPRRGRAGRGEPRGKSAARTGGKGDPILPAGAMEKVQLYQIGLNIHMGNWNCL